MESVFQKNIEDLQYEYRYGDDSGTGIVNFRSASVPENLEIKLNEIPIKYGYRDDLKPGIINDHLIVGSGDLAINLGLLKDYKVTHILNLVYDIENMFEYDFIYKKIIFDDMVDIDITKYFDEAFEFIDKAKKPNCRCLVHCAMGQSRSVSIVIGYLMSRNKLSFDEAYKYVKEKRPSADPNMGFVSRLIDYEKTLNLPINK